MNVSHLLLHKTKDSSTGGAENLVPSSVVMRSKLNTWNCFANSIHMNPGQDLGGTHPVLE
jgi:hypothetical protein